MTHIYLHFLLFLVLAMAGQVSAAVDVSETEDVTPRRVLAGRLHGSVQDTDVHPDLREAVIFLRPTESVDVEPLDEPAVMRMVDKTFVPGVLTVPAGTAVEFPNADPILHNAFSTSSANRFDLGFYPAGASKGTVFDEPGLVRVFCNVHHAMAAYVMVLDTPYFTHADRQGLFSFEVPADVSGTLYVWHPQARVVRRNVNTDAPGDFEISLTFNGRRVPRHLNKHGKPYRRSDRTDY